MVGFAAETKPRRTAFLTAPVPIFGFVLRKNLCFSFSLSLPGGLFIRVRVRAGQACSAEPAAEE
jgi:hypothetical protein